MQSSLGTNAAIKDLSNVATWRFNTGTTSSYIKFNNGLLICWGWITSTGQNRTVYLPMSFLNDSYRVSLTPETPVASILIETLTVRDKTVSSFKVRGDFYNASTSAFGYPGEPFDYIAIGQTKI